MELAALTMTIIIVWGLFSLPSIFYLSKEVCAKNEVHPCMDAALLFNLPRV